MRPPTSVPSRLNSGTPRARHHNHNKLAAPHTRKLACHKGGTSATVILMRICWNPHTAQHTTKRVMARTSR